MHRLTLLKKRFVDSILRKPHYYLLFSLLIFAGVGSQIFKLDSAYSIRIWFEEDSPLIQELNQLEQTFGNDEVLVVNIHSDKGVFRPESIGLLHTLTDKIWQIPGIIRVDSLSNYNHISSRGDDILIESFFDKKKDYSSEALEEKKRIATTDPLLKNRFVSKDGEDYVIRASLKPTFGSESPDYAKIVNSLDEIIENTDLKNHEIRKGGSPVINNSYRTVSDHDLKTVLPIVFGLMILLLIFVFHTWQAVLMPLGLVVMTIISSYGFGAIFDILFNNLTSAIPGILVAICLADSIHIFTTYYQNLGRGESQLDAARLSLEKNFTPTLVTSISTSIGFLSLLWTDLLPVRGLALMACFGTIFAWVLSYCYLGPLLKYCPLKKSTELHSIPESFSQKLVNFLDKNSVKIIIGYLVLTGVMGYIAFQNRINSDPLKHFSERLQVKKDMNYMIDKYGGVGGPQLMIDSGSPNGIKNPEFLRKVDQLSQWLREKEYVGAITSIVPIIKDLNQHLNQDKEEFNKIPETQNKVGQVLFFYTMGLPPGLDLKNQMSLEKRYLRVGVIWGLHDSVTSLREIKRIQEKSEEIGLDLQVTGKLTIYHRMSDFIVQTFLSSIGSACFFISLLMIMVLRSFKLGLISMVPNMVPLIICGGFMTLTGIAIDIGSSLVMAVCFGIVVDDTTHFLTQVRTHSRTMNYKQAVIYVISHTVPALIFTTVILAICFGVFIFGDFIPNVKFGILCSFTLLLALIVDITLLPAIILKTHYFKDEPPTDDDYFE